MKKNFLISIFLLLMTSWSYAQQADAENRYLDYRRYFGDLGATGFAGNGPAPRTVKELQDGAAGLKDEAPLTGNSISTLQAGTKIMDDEDIYAKRKNAVFIVGKLLKGKDAAGNTRFELNGAAFAISGDGTCVTNYHVFNNIINSKSQDAGKDSAYFIITLDKKVYFIDKLLAYSQNNDVAIFRVSTNGEKLATIPLGQPAEVGAAVYCISHPGGYLYYFSKGMVARNVTVGSDQAAAGYDPEGRPPLRMEITADYGIGSSGGPVLDKYGNLAGIISSTAPVWAGQVDEKGNSTVHQQMVVKDTVPLEALNWLLGNTHFPG